MQPSHSLYICTLTEPDGTAAQWMWDADYTGEPLFWNTGAPDNLECNAGQCPALTQTVPGSMQSYIDITGTKNDRNWRPGAGGNSSGSGQSQALSNKQTAARLSFQSRFGTDPIGMS